MGVQYVYNERGKKIGVIVPINLWEGIGSTIEKTKERDFLPSRYRGIYNGLKVNPEKEIRNLREEWERA